MERLLLLDGNGLIYRGYFALIDQPLTTSKGELVTAVFGFTNIVLRAIQDAKPDRIAVAFDLGKPTFRHERYAEYKATRTRMPDDMREQIPKVREVVKALGHPGLRARGVRGGRRRSPRSSGRPRRADLDVDDPHRRPGHAPAGERAHEADGLAARRHREHGRLRPREDRGALGPAARPDARLQGAQGRPDGQHPGHPRGGGEDGVEADRDVGDARRAVRAPRRGDARRSCGRSLERVPRRASSRAAS